MAMPMPVLETLMTQARRNSWSSARKTLPVVAGARATKIQILAYTLILFPLALAPWILGIAGHLYGVSAAVLGGIFILAAISLFADRSERSAKRVFGFSILYLFLLFALIIIDRAPGLMGGFS